MNNYLVLALLIGIALLAVIFAVIAFKNKGQIGREPDYRAFFILGICFLPIGISTENTGLWAMGLIFAILGVANRDKWKEEPKWSELDPQSRRTKFIIIGLLTIVLLAGLLFYILAKSS